MGAGIGYGDTNWGINASVFGDELTRNLAEGSGLGARGFWAPINDKGNILHFGLSYVNYDAKLNENNSRLADTARFRARPDADFSTRLIDTGKLTDTDSIATVGAEAIWVRGPFKLQGEYMKTEAQRSAGLDNFSSSGAYISGVWNITGETWGYKAASPPRHCRTNPPAVCGRSGALRHDGSERRPRAGRQVNTWTAGVNWYWRSNFKFMLNYVKVNSTKTGIDDDPNIVEGRVQFYF